MNTTDLKQIRTLSDLASRAAATLIPMAADGQGRDSHGGQIQRPQETLDRALAALIRAGALASRLRAIAGHPDRGDDLVGHSGSGEGFSGPGEGTPDKGDRPRSSPA